MTKVRMAYFDECLEIDVPERNLLGVLEPDDIRKADDLVAVLAHELENPVATAPFSSLCAGRKKVCILVCDLTRPMETEKVLPVVIEKILEASPEAEISILVALGTHRPLGEEEMDRLVGREIRGRFPVINHDARDETRLTTIGGTRKDFPVQVNSLLVECDFKIGIGAVKPHPVFGWSGGVKIVIPGVSGYGTTGLSHWNSAPFAGTEIMGVVDNPVRLEVEDVVTSNRLLDFIVSAVLDKDSRIADLRCGDPVLAHRKCVGLAKKHYLRDVPAPADVVLVGVGKWGADLWVGSMGVYQSEFFLKRGGTVVLFGKFPEGVSRTHGEILEWGYRPYSEVEPLVRDGTLAGDLTLAAHLVHLGRVLEARQANCVLVSEGISREEAFRLGFDYLDSPDGVLDDAFARHGRDAKILAIPGFNSTPVISEHPVR